MPKQESLAMLGQLLDRDSTGQGVRIHRLPISQSVHTGEVADYSIAIASVLHGYALDIHPTNHLGVYVIVLLLGYLCSLPYRNYEVRLDRRHVKVAGVGTG